MKGSYRWTISTIYFYVYNATPTFVPQIVTLLPAEAARPRFHRAPSDPSIARWSERSDSEAAASWPFYDENY